MTTTSTRRGATPGQVFIHHDDSPVMPTSACAHNTVLCQGNGILNVDSETRIYHGRWRNVGQKAQDIAMSYHAEVALATLPRDRWGALGLNPGVEEGAICSAPFILPVEGSLLVNADGVSGLSVDLLDERFRPIAGFPGGQVVGPDGLDCKVRWAGQRMGELGGRSVLIQVNMRGIGNVAPRVYGLYITAA